MKKYILTPFLICWILLIGNRSVLATQEFDEEQILEVEERVNRTQDVKEYGFVVEITVEFNKGHADATKQKCTGSIISKHHILTSAACLHDKYGNLASNDSVKVTAGNIDDIKPIADIILHEKFQYDRKRNPGRFDIAILKTVEPIHFNATMFSIPLADATIYFGYARIAGWTNADGDRQFSSKSVFFKRDIFSKDILNSHSNTKEYERGSALVRGDKLHGFYIGTKPELMVFQTSVYTSVSSHLDWISSKLTKSTKNVEESEDDMN